MLSDRRRERETSEVRGVKWGESSEAELVRC